MIVIYDSKGKIWYNGSGNGEPDGLPFLNIKIPNGKYLEKIDTSVTPHEPVFKEYPKSEIELLRERVAELEATQAIMLTGESEVTA